VEGDKTDHSKYVLFKDNVNDFSMMNGLLLEPEVVHGDPVVKFWKLTNPDAIQYHTIILINSIPNLIHSIEEERAMQTKTLEEPGGPSLSVV
jgi:hypothetical protein